VAERRGSAADASDESLARDVLRAFGQPREVAARYAQGPQYLIGPALFPTFVIVMKIQLAVIAAISLFTLIVSWSASSGESPRTLAVFAEAGGSFLGAVINNLGITTLVFALIELAIRGRTGGDPTWDPSRLPPVEDPEKSSFVGRIVTLYALAVVATVFNFFPNWVAVLSVDDAGAHVVPLLEPAFRRYVPFANAWWAAAFVLHLVVLREGHWRRATRWCEVGLQLGSAALYGTIVAGPPVFHYDRYIKVGVAIALAIALVTAGIRTWQLLRSTPRPEPWDAASAR
jgi:hypothetical protein